MDVERGMAKPFKHCILTKDRKKLSEAKGVVMFRAGKNLRISIMPTQPSKEKCMHEFLAETPHLMQGLNAAMVSQAEADDEILD
jgi:hypothetical protein